MGTFISTRGRYALRVLLDLADNYGGPRVPLKDIAERQGISLKYMESIMPVLVKGGIVSGSHGKGGGYELNIPPEECMVGKILRLTEGSICTVACLENGSTPCERAAQCRTLPMWKKLDEMINGYLDTVSIKDLISTPHLVEIKE
ncbi:MAG: Rrf2 family transcriptional regulator [Candidatus Methanomethylophilaceae archaeon]|nr:Rrf2 family transcriptional regulator [Candidatus Methanomethylophilaceae archaeon]